MCASSKGSIRPKKIMFLTMLGLIFVNVILIGNLVSMGHKPEPTLNAATEEGKIAPKSEIAPLDAVDVEAAFIRVAKEVGPAVVSISTEQTQRISGPRFYTPFGDDFFDEFFKQFFDIPEQERRQYGLGSGVIIDEEGYILTNEHVIGQADKITITLPDGRKFKGEVKGTDALSDLAVVKIKSDNLPYVRLGDSDKVKIGQWAIAIGNPFGFAVHSPEPTVTVGVISALNRSLYNVGGVSRQYNDLIQTDAAINPGNSGGPLVNIKGEVIGINVAIASTTGGSQGVGFAIPVNTAKSIIGDLIEGKKVLYGWLGINIQDLDEDLSEYFGLKDRQGVVVVKVLENTPADKAGFKEGDVLITFDSQNIKNVKDLLKKVAQAKVGSLVKVGIIHEGKEKIIEVEIGERPGELDEFGRVSATTWRGIEVQEITPEIARRYRLGDEQGVIISEVEPNSPADEAGLQRGDIIYSINRKLVKSVEDYNNITKSIKGPVIVRTNRGFTVVKEAEKEK